MTVEIRRILCPVDSSECSRRALRHAAAIARWYGAGLSVLHVHGVSTPVLAGPLVGFEALQPVAMTDSERRAALAALRDFAFKETGAADVVAVVDEAWDVCRAITAHAASVHADLIVMGTHGRSGFHRFMLGSVTEKVLRRAGCAVLTVPPGSADAAVGDLRYQRILCALDFSEGSSRALDYAGHLAQRGGGSLTALTVVELPADLPDLPQLDLTAYRTARFELARRALNEALQRVRGSCDIHELILIGRPGREIVRVAAEQAADLIVLGVQGRGAIDLAVFGSVAHHVVRHASCPVLAVRTDA